MSLRKAIKELAQRSSWSEVYIIKIISDLQQISVGVDCVAWCMLPKNTQKVIKTIKNNAARDDGPILQYLYQGKWFAVELIDMVNPEVIYRIHPRFDMSKLLSDKTS